ncbi:MAG: hypothetical protein AAB654_19635 [Acidobacteriota bacterium]
MVVLDVELQLEAGEVGLQQLLQAQVVEVVVGIVETEQREIVGRPEDARDRQAGRGGVTDGGRPTAAPEALHLLLPARV